MWANAPGSNPTANAAYLYDGEGHRVEQVATTSGVTTTTTYVGALEEIATTGSTTTTTAYYGGLALSVNGALSYTLSDGLGSVSESVNATTGAVTATQLYAPYGGVRYASGSLPGSHGFTGQHSDAATSGLDYYGARYYDPAAGQFTSADSMLPKQGATSDLSQLNRYAYVGGNPETMADPSGHRRTDVIGGLEMANSAMPWVQGLVGFGKTLYDSRDLYVKMATYRAKMQYKLAKNAAIAEKHTNGERGGLSKAELKLLADERNAREAAAADNAEMLDRYLEPMKGIGRFLLVAGIAADGGLSGYTQWNRDASGGYTTGQRRARAITAGAVHAGLDAIIGISTAYVIELAVTGAVGVLFAETGPADPFIMVAAFSLTTAVLSGGGAAVATNMATPAVNSFSDWATNTVGSWFS